VTGGSATLPAGAYAVLEVADTGVGMDAATVARIFEPFFTTKGEGKGTGLGLATVHGLVAQSGGSVRVRSEPGRGTAFEVWLPASDAPPAREEGPAAPAPACVTGEGTILVVEDEDPVRGMICETLRSRGFTVLEAAHGGEAVALAERHAGPIHLLVTDVVMAGMTGHQLARELQGRRPELQVLYMSGYAEESVRRFGVTGPDTAFLQKPVTPALLFAAIAGRLPGGRRPA
jgi:CheY-like chemotaxis protein